MGRKVTTKEVRGYLHVNEGRVVQLATEKWQRETAKLFSDLFVSCCWEKGGKGEEADIDAAVKPIEDIWQHKGTEWRQSKNQEKETTASNSERCFYSFLN